MDLSRLESALDVERLENQEVALFGAGGSVGLAEDLARSGVGGFTLVDPDTVESSNVARQGHDPENVGRPKVDVLAGRLRRINPHVRVRTIPRNCNGLTDDELRAEFADIDLVIAATDSFPAQARCHQLALIFGVPFVAIGVSAAGLGGEVAWWAPGRTSCFRCLCANRFAFQERAAAEGRSLDPSSDGVDIHVVRIVDGIAAQIVLGLLTRGADNRYGRLIDQLGDRQFLMIGLSPDYRIAGKDVVRTKLGIDEDNPAFFAWNTIALSDPDEGRLPCPDCERFRGVTFEETEGGWVRHAVAAGSGV